MLILMKGIGENSAARFIAEVGDVRRFHNASALIAFAGIDTPANQSGQFNNTSNSNCLNNCLLISLYKLKLLIRLVIIFINIINKIIISKFAILG